MKPLASFKGQIKLTEIQADGNIIHHKAKNLVLKNMKPFIATELFGAVNSIFPQQQGWYYPTINGVRTRVLMESFLVIGTGGYFPGDDYSTLPKVDFEDTSCFKAQKTTTNVLSSSSLPYPVIPPNDQMLGPFPNGFEPSVFIDENGTFTPNYFALSPGGTVYNWSQDGLQKGYITKTDEGLNGWKVTLSSLETSMLDISAVFSQLNLPSIVKNGKISLVEFSICPNLFPLGDNSASTKYGIIQIGEALKSTIAKVIEPFEVMANSKIKLEWDIYV